MALIEKLSAIGDAIRAKTGGSELLTLDQMPTEIAAIQTGGGSAFSADTHDVIMINQSAKDSTGYYCWQDWESYIANLDDIEVLLVYYGSSASYMFVKGVMAERDAENKLPTIYGLIESSYARTTLSDRTGTSYMQFVEGTGLCISYNGSSLSTVPTRGATIYCIVKKGA